MPPLGIPDLLVVLVLAMILLGPPLLARPSPVSAGSRPARASRFDKSAEWTRADWLLVLSVGLLGLLAVALAVSPR